MKKFLTMLLLLFATIASAQTEKGSFMIGGNASIEFYRNDQNDDLGESKTFAMDISPRGGYLVADNLSLGLSLPVSISRGKSTYAGIDGEYQSSSNGFGVAPFVRYYIPVKEFYLVTEAAYSWQRSKNGYDSFDPVTGDIIGSDEFRTTVSAFRIAAGPTFFLSRYTSVEILANYQYADWKADSPLFTTSNFYISVGFQIYLPKIKE